MGFKLHYLPEKPTHSCIVVVFCKSHYGEHINFVSNVGYSEKYGLFNAYDHELADEVGENAVHSVVAWAYMDEVSEEVMKHVG